jgi:phosphatidate phosphatase APP1
MGHWQRKLAGVVHTLERGVDGLRRRLGPAPDERRDLAIVPYIGYGSRRRLFVQGRVLANHALQAASESDSVWINLLNMYRRLESDEVPGVKVKASFQSATCEVVTDEEGFFQAWLDSGLPPRGDRSWHEVDVTLPSSPAGAQPSASAVAQVMIPPAEAQFGVISDIDDTVMKTYATDLLRMARLVFLGNARTRLPFPGVAAFYRALGSLNPLFYVSSSPWNLYDLLVDFFKIQGIPLGPLFLRDWGVTSTEFLPTEHHGHKLAVIERLFQFYPRLSFILVGDSGQQDPEIYTQIVRRYPQRVLAVYVRNVVESESRRGAIAELAEEVAASGSALVLAQDTLAMARHAAGQGWIAAAAVEDVAQEVNAGHEKQTPSQAVVIAEE